MPGANPGDSRPTVIVFSMTNSRAFWSRITVLVRAFLAVTFLTGSHCGNEITAPLATPTHAPPTPTPTPAPATLSGQVLTRRSPTEPYQPYSGAQIALVQGSKVSGTTSASDGSYKITGVMSGPATISAIQAFTGQFCNVLCNTGDVSLTLRPGANTFIIDMPCDRTATCHF